MSHQFGRLADRRRRRPASRPSYVERGGEMVTRHPFDAYRVRMTVFALDSGEARVDALCERTFALPSRGAEDYVQVGGHVLLVFARIREIRSSHAPDDALGVAGERECGLWVPLLDRNRRRATWTIPYLYVDQPAAAMGGREIFGYPKQIADVRIADDASRFSVKAPCIRRFGTTARMQRHEVLSARRTGTGDAPSAPFTTAASAVEHLVDGRVGHVLRLAARAALPAHLLRAARDVQAAAMFLAQVAYGRIPVVQLKQFRDVTDPRVACYQAITETCHDVLAFREGALVTDPYEIDVQSLDGQPFERDLGLVSGRHTPDLAFWLDFDMRIQAGTALWEAAR